MRGTRRAQGTSRCTGRTVAAAVGQWVMPPGSRYAAHLARGLAAYEERTGRRPSEAELDVERPAVRAAYDRFRRKLVRAPLGATAGEWAHLELGDKRVLRERLDGDRLDALRQRCARDGWELEVRALPSATRSHAVDGADTAPLRGYHAYVGRERDLLVEAADLDGKMIPHQAAPDEHPEGATADETRRLGELLGYPDCCTAAFARHHGIGVDNWRPIASAAAASARFDWRLDNLTLGYLHLVAWFPCTYDCAASLAIAERVAASLRARHPDRYEAAVAPLTWPRVYFDERRQLLLDGAPADGELRYRAVHTPYALDRQAGSAAYEWVFFADVAETVARGDRLWLEGDELVVARSDAELSRIHAPDAVLLPFAR